MLIRSDLAAHARRLRRQQKRHLATNRSRRPLRHNGLVNSEIILIPRKLQNYFRLLLLPPSAPQHAKDKGTIARGAQKTHA